MDTRRNRRGTRGALIAVLSLGVVVAGCDGVLGIDGLTIGCVEGAKQCAENTLRTCNAAGSWGEQACVDTTCDPIQLECVGECAPGRRCVDTTPQTCDASGHWKSEPACEEGKLCEGGVCVVDCTPGDLRCMENTPQTCDADGEWQGSEACVSQTCILAECMGECAPGEEQCAGDMFETCGTNGEWEIPAASHYKTCCNGSLVNAATDPENCAMCGITCNEAAGEICQIGGAPGPTCANVEWARWPMPNGAVDVAAGAPNLAGYTDNGDGTVTDMVTGLMWQKEIAPGAYPWSEAKSYCSITLSDLALGGHHDWRLPSRIELASLVDYGISDPPLINATFFPGTPSDYFWSATPVKGVQSSAWVVLFYVSYAGIDDVTNADRVRCVR